MAQGIFQDFRSSEIRPDRERPWRQEPVSSAHDRSGDLWVALRTKASACSNKPRCIYVCRMVPWSAIMGTQQNVKLILCRSLADDLHG